jgi:phage shock protein A
MWENDLIVLKSQRKAAQLTFDLAQTHLAALNRQIDTLEENIHQLRHGQLPLFPRGECPE